jgi:hypothetical protein
VLRRTEYPIPGNSNGTRPKSLGVKLKGELRLSYRVAGAGWSPLYDARLTPGEKGGSPRVTTATTRASARPRSNSSARLGTAAHGRGLGRRRARRLDGSGKPRRGCARRVRQQARALRPEWVCLLIIEEFELWKGHLGAHVRFADQLPRASNALPRHRRIAEAHTPDLGRGALGRERHVWRPRTVA